MTHSREALGDQECLDIPILRQVIHLLYALHGNRQALLQSRYDQSGCAGLPVSNTRTTLEHRLRYVDPMTCAGCWLWVDVVSEQQ